jgi:hypothetical protein
MFNQDVQRRINCVSSCFLISSLKINLMVDISSRFTAFLRIISQFAVNSPPVKDSESLIATGINICADLIMIQQHRFISQNK